MILFYNRQRRAFLWAILFCPFLFYFYIVHTESPQPDVPYRAAGRAATAHRHVTLHPHAAAPQVVLDSSAPSRELAHFWKVLLHEMTKNSPGIDPIQLERNAQELEYDPNWPNRTWDRLEIATLPDQELQTISQAHSAFVGGIGRLASLMPYAPNSRGIVMTAGGKYFGIAITSLLMLRHTGTQLPVQLFLDSEADYDADVCERVLPALNASCTVMERLWAVTPTMPPMDKFQFKVFAIIFSTFQEVLFLDADCWSVKPPDSLFTSEPFLSRGMVTWPDFWLSTASPLFYQIAGVHDAPPLTARLSTESGILLYDKARHASTLALAAYYNFYGPSHFYPLLSQGAIGQGDKETFLHAALALDAPFYDVRTHIGVLGRWINGTFESAGMTQADPLADWHLTALPPPEARTGGGGMKSTDTRSEASQGKRFETVHAPVFFIHHNQVKLDIRDLNHSLRNLYRDDEKNGAQRLWGDDDKVKRAAGYDVERVLWEAVLRVDCDATLLGECARLRKWFEGVFR